MLPPAYELPAAVLLILTGAIACVAGYRFFRLVLAVYGFIFGALIASSAMGISNTAGMIGAALIVPISVYAAPIGVRVAHGLPKRTLELAFALFLGSMSTRFLLGWLGVLH